MSPSERVSTGRARRAAYSRRKHLQWRLRVRRLLPTLDARIKALDGLMYLGCGGHYELPRRLNKLATFLAASAPDDVALRLTHQVVAQSLIRTIARAERSARTDCARYNRGRLAPSIHQQRPAG